MKRNICIQGCAAPWGFTVRVRSLYPGPLLWPNRQRSFVRDCYGCYERRSSWRNRHRHECENEYRR